MPNIGAMDGLLEIRHVGLMRKALFCDVLFGLMGLVKNAVILRLVRRDEWMV
jgi:hypothetical protein